MEISSQKLNSLTNLVPGTTFSVILPLFPATKEGNVLFNDTLNTFYLRLYGIGHMVKDHSDIKRKPSTATWATLSI